MRGFCTGLAILTAPVLSGSDVLAQAVPIPDPEPASKQSDAPPVPPSYSNPPVVAAAASVKPPKAPTSPVVSAAPGPGQFSLHMNDGTCLVGVFGETKAVPFEAVFGKIEIPMTSIRTVDFTVIINGAKTHRVHFINGDSLTGNVGRIAPIKFTTSYGILEVPMEQVSRMTGPATHANPTPATVAVAHKTEAVAQANVPVPIADAAPGPIRPATGVIVPDDEVR